MKRTNIVMVSPAILMLVITSTLSYVTGYPRALDLTRYLIAISARFALVMFMVLIPLPFLPRLLPRLSKASKNRSRFSLVTSRESYSEPSRLGLLFFKPLEGIGLSLVLAESALQFLGFLPGVSPSHLFVPLILFAFGNLLVSFLLSTVWAFDYLGIKICSETSGEVRRLSTALGVAFPMPLITGAAGIAVLFHHSAIPDALVDLLRIVTVLYPPYAIFAFVHHEFFRRRSVVLQKLFVREQ